MKIIIYKSRRLLVCMRGGEEFLRAGIQLGSGADEGAKLREGDGRTPEGEYVISSKNPVSRFFRSLGLSYPSPADAARGLAAGIICYEEYKRICRDPARPPWDTHMGGYIMIHGQRTPPVSGDWTAGCIAVDNDSMARLYDAAEKGDTVYIYP